MSKRQRHGRSAHSTGLQDEGNPFDDHRHREFFGRREARNVHPSHCTSCETVLDKFEKANHRQLQGRCSGCHQLFSEGKYCPVCLRVWRPEDENMVGCDTCQFWVHSHCDQVARNALTKGGQMDYFCPQCRKVRNINNRLAAIKQAHDDLSRHQPRPARSAFQLFAHEFEKQCRANPRRSDPRALLNQTWRNLTFEERAPYERAAAIDLARFNKEQRACNEYERRYTELQFAAQQDGILDETGRPIKHSKFIPTSPPAAPSRPSGTVQRGPGRPASASQARSGDLGRPAGGRAAALPPALARDPPPRSGPSAGKPALGRKRSKSKEDSPDYVPHANKKRRDGEPVRLGKVTDFSAAAKPKVEGVEPTVDASTSDPSDQLEVFCNDVHGTLYLRRQRVICRCPDCAAQPGGSREFSCTQFEQHGGSGTAKKWKASLKIVPGSTPDVPAGGPPLSVGKWMEKVGMDLKPGGHRVQAGPPTVVVTRAKDMPAPPRRQASPSPSSLSAPPPAAPAPRPVKKEEKDYSGMFEPWLEIPNGHFRPMKVRWAGERCSVCDSDVDFDFDQLVSCDQCGITVHQTCYGVSELPGEDDLWLCRVCEHMKEGEARPQCCLCPVTGGALKQTTEPGVWCHSACMQWIPEVTVEDLNRMEPISHIRSIQKERWDLNCSVCKQKAGAKIQCSKCYTAYHPLCGRVAGLLMEMQEPDGPNEALRLVSLCHKHCTPKPQMTGVTLISAEEEARQRRQGEGNGLWNAQLFPPPALVPVPECPSGTARVEKLQSQDWVRKSHGKRNGFSSTSGFWIPKQQLSVYRPKIKIARANKRRSTVSHLGRGRPLSASRPKAPKLSRTDTDVEDMLEIQPVPEVSASRFEAICGKGDAKKWKSSLWFEDDDGQPLMMMQEWLDGRKLDRKVLAGLAANYASAESYLEYCAFEVSNVLSDLIDDVAKEDEEAEPPQKATVTHQDEAVSNEAAQEKQAPEQPENAEAAKGAATEPTVAPAAEPLLMQESAQTMSQLPIVEAEKIKAQEAGDAHQESSLSSRTNLDVQHGAQSLLTQPSQPISQGPQADHASAAEGAGQTETTVTDAGNEAAQPIEAAIGTKDGEKMQIENGGPSTEQDQSAALKTAADRQNTPGAAPDGLASDAPAITPPQPPQGSGPAAVLGQICEVHFVEDKEWYKAIVRGYDKASKLHNLWYFYDEEAEWIDLVEEDRSGRVRWQNSKLSAYLRESGEGKRKKPPPPVGRDARQGDPTPTGDAAIDWRISVWWKDDACFYKGIIEAYNPESGRHRVKYDDNEVEHLMLSAEHIRWDQRPALWDSQQAALKASQAQSTPGQAPLQMNNDLEAGTLDQDVAAQFAQHSDPTAVLEAQAMERQEMADAPTRRSHGGNARPPPVHREPPPPAVEDNPEERAQRAANAPDSIPVICNMTTAVYITQRGLIQMHNGQVVSPTEFERMSGKAASKKWKASIRIDKGGGSPGITIGDWLIDQGLEPPKAPRVRSDGGVSHQQRRTLAMRTLTTSPGSTSRAQGHRESCMCVICKQARRTGKPWAGMDADKSQPASSQSARTQPSRMTVTSGARFGKRAFIRCTGQFVRGSCNRQKWELPQSKMYTAEEWETLHANAPTPELVKPEEPADNQDIVMQDAHDSAADSSAKPIKMEGEGNLKPEPLSEDAISAVVKPETNPERRALTLKERLEICQATERQRLTFCKSGIHGWGLIARVEMKQDSMIIEYRGETLRRAMADEREKEYRVKELDCYLFNINDDVVVDATMKGTIGRFTNHCCSPSLYTKVVEVDSKPHVVFFARQDIRIGQELTYDYRFKEEEGDNKLLCQCGAPNCRGTMN